MIINIFTLIYPCVLKVGEDTAEILLSQIYNQYWLSKLVIKSLLSFYWSAFWQSVGVLCACENKGLELSLQKIYKCAKAS